MNSVNSIIAGGLRNDVRNFYPLYAVRNGGCVYTAYKGDKRAFKLRVQCAVNMAAKCLDLISERYPINNN